MRWEFEPRMLMGLILLNLHLHRWTVFPNLNMTILDHNLRSPYLWILNQPSVSVPLSQFLSFQWCAALRSPSPPQPFAFLQRVLIFPPLWSTNLNFFLPNSFFFFFLPFFSTWPLILFFFILKVSSFFALFHVFSLKVSVRLCLSLSVYVSFFFQTPFYPPLLCVFLYPCLSSCTLPCC